MYDAGGDTRGGKGLPEYKKARQTTIAARPAPAVSFMSAPAKSNSSGQYKSGGGGGRPSSAPVAHQGPVSGVGRSGPRTPARSTHGNNSGGGGGGKGGGKGNGGGGGKPKAKNPMPSLKQYLNSDTAYQSGLSELMKNLQQFKTGNMDSQGDVKESFQTAMERMGKERTDALSSLKDDFGSRGLLTSGLYSDAVSKYDSDYNDRTADLTKDQQNQLEDLTRQLSNMTSLTGTKKQDLRLDAMRRRADKLGIK